MKCIEDEIPFEIPESWEWCRFLSGFIINPRNSIQDNIEVSFIPMPLIQEGYTNNHKSEIRLWKKVKTRYTHFAENDIAIAKITPCFENKKSVVFKNLSNGYGAGTTELHIIRTLENTVLPEYVLWYIKRDDFISDGINAFSGAVGQKRIGREFIEQYLIPLPPVSEQEKILEAIHTAFMSIDSIECSYTKLNALITIAKSKILDLAIRGKLVPQDPNDEPASVLLERIKVEKEELIKQGKIKRDKKESVIFKGEDNSYYEKIGNQVTCIDSEIAFEIPENWAWSRLSSFTEIVMGSSPKGEDICADSSFTEFHQGKIYFSKQYINCSMQYTKNISKLASKNSVLLCVRAPVGEVNITNRDICIGRGLSSILPLDDIDSIFLFYWLKTFKKEFTNKSTGSTFSAITSDIVKNILLPVPPLNEQNKITKTITDMFDYLEHIEASLN